METLRGRRPWGFELTEVLETRTEITGVNHAKTDQDQRRKNVEERGMDAEIACSCETGSSDFASKNTEDKNL